MEHHYDGSEITVPTSSENRLHRVRINSGAVMDLLSRVSGADRWKGKSHTFSRPFRAFYHFHKKIKQELLDMRDWQTESVIASKSTPVPRTIDTAGGSIPATTDSRTENHSLSVNSSKGRLKSWEFGYCGLLILAPLIG